MGIFLEKLKSFRFRSDKPNNSNAPKAICFHHHGIERIMYLGPNEQSMDKAYYRDGVFLGYPEKDECLKARIKNAVEKSNEVIDWK